MTSLYDFNNYIFSSPVQINSSTIVQAIKYLPDFIKVKNTLVSCSLSSTDDRNFYISRSTNNGSSWTTISYTLDVPILKLATGSYIDSNPTFTPSLNPTSYVLASRGSGTSWNINIFYNILAPASNTKIFNPEIEYQITNIITVQTTSSYIFIVYTIFKSGNYETYLLRTTNPSVSVNPATAIPVISSSDHTASTLIYNKGRLILSYSTNGLPTFFVIYSDDNGSTWSPQVTVPGVHRTVNGQRLLCVDNQGNVCAVNGQFARSIDNCSSFENTISYIASP